MATPTLLSLAKQAGYGFGWSLALAMGQARISIRDLATWTGLTQRRVRHVRAVGVQAFPFEVGFDLYMAVENLKRARSLNSGR